jgi:ParB-like chromosome segregation protein Spo0J
MAVDRVTPAMARRIELWPVGRLAPYQRNPRTHSEEQVTQIAASIAEFGFCNPILGGLARRHRRRPRPAPGGEEAGPREVPVIVLDHLDETQRRAYLLADNRLSELAGWDQELLALELKELADAGFDATLAGFDSKEIDDFLASLERDAETEPEEAADAVPECPPRR